MRKRVLKIGDGADSHIRTAGDIEYSGLRGRENEAMVMLRGFRPVGKLCRGHRD